MNRTIQNIVVVLVGVVIGGGLNSLLIQFGHLAVPYPEGIDMSNPESLAENIHLLKPMNYLMVFLAHALGTLIASFIIAKFAASHHYRLAMIPGVLFLIGGIIMTLVVDAPTWFDATDLLLAYFPMAYLGYTLGRNKK